MKFFFKLFSFSKNVNVTFWRSFAEEFEQAMSKELQQPVIIIIASARVTQYKGQCIVSFSHTAPLLSSMI